MPWPTYSEQLVRHTGSIALTEYTCPAGRRWVIKNVTMAGLAGSVQGARIYIGGTPILWVVVQATQYGASYTLHQVVYGGQKLGVQLSDPGVGVGIGGFSFADAQREREVPEAEIDEAFEAPAPAPAWMPDELATR